MQEKEIIYLLNIYNPWWTQKTLPEENSWFKRNIFNLLFQKYLQTRQIISLVGLRRVGKTTILKQIIAYLLSKEINPRNICFFSFEKELVPLNSQSLKEIVQTYLEIVLYKSINSLNEKIYIFLDEIQYIQNFQGILKFFYDLNPNLKFFISGSSSLFITKKSVESLAGRQFEIEVPTLSFREFIELYGYHKTDLNISKVILSNFTLTELNKEIVRELKFSVLSSLNRFISLYEQYLYKGSFPELKNFSDSQGEFNELIQKYIKEQILKKIIEFDLPKILTIEKPEELKILFSILVKETGNLIELLKLSSESQVSLNTLKKYIGFLQDAFLVSFISNYTKSIRPSKRYLKKVYVTSCNFTYSLLNLTPERIEPYTLGHLVETDVFNKLRGLYGDSISFWSKRKEEVDFVINLAGEKLLIETKYTDNLNAKSYATLFKLMNRWNIKKGIVLTKKDFDIIEKQNSQIYLIPVWLI